MKSLEPAALCDFYRRGVLAFLFCKLPLHKLGGRIMKHGQQRIIGNRVLCRIIRELPAILALMMAVTLGVASRGWAAPFAYITNAVFPGPPVVYRVSVIDTATNSVVTHVPLSGVVPYGVAGSYRWISAGLN